ncbi:MAG: tRNA uridine(34) 5-carboxymethylaminomethyl modification radical SAM/GNAT enzyme Elp3 [Candidatus Altiarchaeales archaeon ex4484_2]|nr:MAG: tRNA uridine(34) 5-carboxymethylaminomethyl modification radical SAM/GNAT enzyme Elp3 [Candidatus Altiarchaeales archaeon ex4484_2]
MESDKALSEIISLLKKGGISSKDDLNRVKIKVSCSYSLESIPRDSEILDRLGPSGRKRFLELLRKKPSRTLSGVAVVAVMTRPHRCPHGRCGYCPGGPEINTPQSYTGKEPAARRAIQYSFHPYLQTTFRLHQLKSIGHSVDKVELIVMGGTLTSQCIDYQDWFVKECLRAMNDFESNHESIKRNGEDVFVKGFNSGEKRFRYREDIQRENESSMVRCVGLTFEPRPDWARREQINWMLSFGVTRVETGVQNPFDFIYHRVNRGHRVDDVVESTREMKDSGLKVSYHMMPGLLGNRPELDLRGFEMVFNEERFKPDMLKIYPCLVIKGTEYYKMWRGGLFHPLETDDAVDLLVKVKKVMPPWIRTMRIMRDIPSNLVEAGIKASNLGELLYRRMSELGVKCRCIRCREVGRFLSRGVEPGIDDIELSRIEYTASGGREIFLSFEDRRKDILIGFLRLRIPSKPFRPEIDEHTALVRELHVYGPMVEVGEKPLSEWQHRGYGRELLSEAERISREEFDMKQVLVTSGIGARNYYRKFGYRREGVYMGKVLDFA